MFINGLRHGPVLNVVLDLLNSIFMVSTQSPPRGQISKMRLFIFTCASLASCTLLVRISSKISNDHSGKMFKVVMMAESKPRANAPVRMVSAPKNTIRPAFKQAAPSSKSLLVNFKPQKLGISCSAKVQNRGMDTA